MEKVFPLNIPIPTQLRGEKSIKNCIYLHLLPKTMYCRLDLWFHKLNTYIYWTTYGLKVVCLEYLLL